MERVSLCLKNVKLLDVSSGRLIPSRFCAASGIMCVFFYLLLRVSFVHAWTLACSTVDVMTEA